MCLTVLMGFGVLIYVNTMLGACAGVCKCVSFYSAHNGTLVSVVAAFSKAKAIVE